MREIITPDWPITQKKYEVLALQEFLKDKEFKHVLEIGTWQGTSALLWAMMVAPENGRVWCCDLSFSYGSFYSNLNGKTYTQPMYRDTVYQKYVTELQGDSHDPKFIERVSKEVGLTPLDFMFIDGDHTYEGVRADFINFHPFVKTGGYIAFHDILDTPWHRQVGCNVKPLWDELKTKFEFWEFVDNNEYLCFGSPNPSKSMGIGVIKIK
jgi:cephalosporin hydroxylase